jgi:hypothetical protein
MSVIRCCPERVVAIVAGDIERIVGGTTRLLALMKRWLAGSAPCGSWLKSASPVQSASPVDPGAGKIVGRPLAQRHRPHRGEADMAVDIGIDDVLLGRMPQLQRRLEGRPVMGTVHAAERLDRRVAAFSATNDSATALPLPTAAARSGIDVGDHRPMPGFADLQMDVVAEADLDHLVAGDEGGLSVRRLDTGWGRSGDTSSTNKSWTSPPVVVAPQAIRSLWPRIW